jgi:hypothetical protein
MISTKRWRAASRAVAFSLILTGFVSRAVVCAVVVDFDDVPPGAFLTGSGYDGLIWESGNLGSSNLPGEWHIPTVANYPNSQPNNVNNAQGSTLMGIGFFDRAQAAGAYFAVQGDPEASWATAVRVHAYIQGQPTLTTAWLSPLTTTPQWLDMTSLGELDRIVIEAAPAQFSTVGGFGMDDLTFTYIPEPASLSLLALGGLLLWRRRSRSKQSEKSSAASISVKENAE